MTMQFNFSVKSISILCFTLIASVCNGQYGYIENLGQWNSEVSFLKEIPSSILYLKKGSISVLQYDDQDWAELVDHGAHTDNLIHKIASKNHKVKYHHYEIEFVGANLTCVPIGINAKSHYYNYFLGNDASKHVHHVKEYDDVLYTALYPNVDLIVHSNSNGLKYDFVLHPGADINDIKIRYNHIDALAQLGDSIKIKTSLGKIYEHIPLAYTLSNDGYQPVQCNYVLQNGIIGFSAKYDPSETFVIDPEVVFATYAGNSSDNFGFTATYDETGHLYAGGIVTSPTISFNKNGRYPATKGAFSENYNGGVSSIDDYEFPCDVSLSKYSPDGDKLIYATYLGGSSNEYPHSIVVDKYNQLIVFGTTFSINFPTSMNAFESFHQGESDIFITKFKSDCSAMIGSTFIGGKKKDGLNEENMLNFFYADNFRGEVITDSNGFIYASSCTVSDDFPLQNAIQSFRNGYQDGVFIMLDSTLSTLLWSTYLGGDKGDALYSVDIDNKGLVYVSGGTKSGNLPKSTGKIGITYKGGSSDGFISILDPSRKELVKSAYWGGDSYDQIFSLELDFENKVYVVGQSMSKMPITSNVYNNINSGQFISKFDENLDVVEFSTVFGTGKNNPDITINAFLVDECRKIFVSGWGGKNSNRSFSSTYRLPITKDAYQDTTDGSDFYLMVLSKHARELLYGTFFGGNLTYDHVDGGTSRFDKKGVIYQSVCSSCPDPGQGPFSDFPTTKGAYAEKNVSPRCSNASFKIAFGNLNRPPNLTDKLLRVKALDTLFDTYFITDPDEDSLFISLIPDVRLSGKLVQFKAKSKALANWSQQIGITAGCENIGDTLTILVHAEDKGCPSKRDSSSVIRIVVDPPPVLDPPEKLCLKFIDDNVVEITWSSISASKYFHKYTIYRTDPSGNTKVLAEVNNTNGITYQDKDVANPKLRNYSYYVVVTNLCGMEGPKSYVVSTTKEFTAPIESTYIVTATVNDQDEIEIYWLHSKETDFGSYDIYRKFNSDKNSYEYLGSTYSRMDTMYIDKNVQVNKQSYCYVLVVNDDCGNVSKQSNSGCTIVLEGSTSPFEHQLYWNEYTTWAGGVHEYTLSRSVDTGSLRPLITTPFDWRYHQDTVFNYDWGGYWYRVKAFENGGSYDAISQSNRIYLIQPPLLHVPNAFTPNGDGLNELWGIVPVFVKEYQLNVYNRWGEKVFETTNKHVDWDGFYKNLQTANSVYVYTVRYTGWDKSIHHRKGTVTIVK